MAIPLGLEKYRLCVDSTCTIQAQGKVTNIVGLVIEAHGPMSRLGTVCDIYTRGDHRKISAEVMGFRDNRVMMMPLEEMRGIGPGCPNRMERIESGLLSFGGDTDAQTNPFEVRLGKYVDLDAPDDVIGILALRRLQERGPQRHQLGVALDNDDKLSSLDRWSKVFKGATMAGHMTANGWSPRLEMNIGLCLVWTGLAPGDRVHVELPDGRRIDGEMRDLPFL